jgi:membrane protein YqaA with SNARE-associated domain
MGAPEELAIVLGVIFGVNLLPAFGPPTWAVLVFFSFEFGLPAPVLVLGGALAAASGRLVLAGGARRLRPHLSQERVESIDRTEVALTRNRLRSFGGLALFALSPVPSGQLFAGAGLMRVPLVPLTAAFFAGRLVSYSIYVGAANVASESLGSIATDALTSPLGLGLQLAMLLALALLAGGLNPGRTRRGPPPRRSGRHASDAQPR